MPVFEAYFFFFSIFFEESQRFFQSYIIFSLTPYFLAVAQWFEEIARTTFILKLASYFILFAGRATRMIYFQLRYLATEYHNIYMYIYIYIYIVVPRHTISWYHNSSLWLHPQDASSRDQNPADFTPVGYIILKPSSYSALVEEFFTYTFLHTRNQLPGVLNSLEELLHFSL